MEQLDIFSIQDDYEEFKLKELQQYYKLDDLEFEIARGLKQNHSGKKHPITMPQLAHLWSISERKARDIIKNISESGYITIVSSANGYYVAVTEEEFFEANKMLESRIKGSIRRYILNGANNPNWLFNHIKDCLEEREKQPNHQINIYKEETQHYQEKK